MTADRTRPLVAVVICAYTVDRWNDIAAAIDSLGRQTLPPAEVVLVADHNDQLYDRAVRDLLPRLDTLRVIRNAGRRGASGSRNTGIAATSSPLVAFLDDDANPDPTWLTELVRPFAESAVLVTGGRAVPVWPVDRPAWWPEEFDWVVGSSYRGMPTRTTDVRNVWSCSMAMRREVVELAGLFREGVGREGRVPLGGEETELCIKVRQARADARVVYTPASLVRHRVSDDRVRWRYFTSRCRAEGLSKAQISAAVGADATDSERGYVLRTLPVGMLRALLGPIRGDLAGLARAGAIVIGLLLTMYGFLLGRWRKVT